MYKTECVCLSVLCSLCTATVLSGSAQMHVVSLYPTDRHGWLACADQTRGLVLSAPELARTTD